MLIKYVRTPKHYEAFVVNTPEGPKACVKELGGNPIGIIVSPERGKVGWSLCNPLDKFNKIIGLKIAENRADFYGKNKQSVIFDCPNSIKTDIINMYDRSEKFYK